MTVVDLVVREPFCLLLSVSFSATAAFRQAVHPQALHQWK